MIKKRIMIPLISALVAAITFSAVPVCSKAAESGILFDSIFNIIEVEISDEEYVNGLVLSVERSDYPDLTDEEFANFRNVAYGDIAEGVLYRSSSPIYTGIGRNEYADKLLSDFGIKSIINLAEDEEYAKSYEGFDQTVYSSRNVTYIDMDTNYNEEDFQIRLSKCLRAIAEKDGPYLIHCIYGRDRTGIVCAILEAYLGATLSEIKEDYVKTYENLYTVEEGKQQPIRESAKEYLGGYIVYILSITYGIDVTEENLSEATEEYLKSIGMIECELSALRAHLTGGDYNPTCSREES